MDTKIYGLDFGTTNSAISILDNGEAKVLPIGRHGQKTVRSVLFFPQDSSRAYVGEEAILKYVSSGMKGRLLQSIKSALTDEGFIGTMINGKKYTVEDLISIIIKELRQKADALVGEEINSVVLGRPAIFSDNLKKESLAQERLKCAAQMAGFEKVYFQLEPIAAAFDYEMTLDKEETVLVADLGGGTSDFTVIKLSPQTSKNKDRREDILSVGGVYIGGDNFDSQIMSHKLLMYFGSLSNYKSGAKWLHIPNRLTATLCDWRRISFLKSDKDEMKLISEI
ncbi:MAG: Hsp70 family protein, partial [Patescibacteria group bacterium]